MADSRQSVSEAFRFEIDCISTNDWLDLDALLGQEVTLRLLQAGGGKRHWHGYVPMPCNSGSMAVLPGRA